MHKKIALYLAFMLMPCELLAREPEVVEAIKDALQPVQKTHQEIHQIVVEKLKSLQPDDP